MKNNLIKILKKKKNNLINLKKYTKIYLIKFFLQNRSIQIKNRGILLLLLFKVNIKIKNNLICINSSRRKSIYSYFCLSRHSLNKFGKSGSLHNFKNNS